MASGFYQGSGAKVFSRLKKSIRRTRPGEGGNVGYQVKEIAENGSLLMRR